MDKHCNQCRHYRAYRAMTQRLIRDLGADDVQLMGELIRMMQQERQQQESEAAQLQHLVRQDHQQWESRPEMTDYCGLHDDRGIGYVAALKNTDADCVDYETTTNETKDCASCRHRIIPGGPDRDASHLAELAALSANATALGQHNGTTQVDEYKNYISISKTLEAAQAFNAKRVSYQRPDYLPLCAKRSVGANFALCVVENPHDTCADWEALRGAPAQSTGSGWQSLGAITASRTK